MFNFVIAFMFSKKLSYAYVYCHYNKNLLLACLQSLSILKAQLRKNHTHLLLAVFVFTMHLRNLIRLYTLRLTLRKIAI